MRRDAHQLGLHFGHDTQGTFAADHQIAQVEPVVRALPHRSRHQRRVEIQLARQGPVNQRRQQPIEGVSAGPTPVARPVGEDVFLAVEHQVGQSRVNPAFKTVQFAFASRRIHVQGTEAGKRSVRQVYVRLGHVVDHHPVQDAVAAGGIVAHASANGGAVGAGWIGTDHQPVLPELQIHALQIHSGLNPQCFLLDIDLDYILHVAAEVQHHGRAHGLARQRGSAAAGQHRETVSVGMFQNALDIVRGSGQHHSERHDLIDRRVGAVQHAAVLIKPYVAVDLARHRVGGIRQLLRFVLRLEFKHSGLGWEVLHWFGPVLW